MRRLDEIRYTSNIGVLIAAGESEKIEFKSSLHHPYGPVPPALQALQPGQQKKEIKKALAKSVTRTAVTWHTGDGGEIFYIRAANGTRELNGSSFLKYFREHWPS